MKKEKEKDLKKSTLVRLSQTELQKIESLMESENRSFSFLVSSIVKEYLKKQKVEKPTK